MVKERLAQNALTILVTGVGAPGTRGTLHALKKNHQDEERNLKIKKIIGIDLRQDAIGKYWVDKFYNVPSPESENYVGQINDICSEESVDIIIPQTTRETAELSKNLKRIRSKVTVSKISAIEKANNKYELMRACERLEIPIPEFFLVKSLDGLIDRAKELGYPEKEVVVKPPVSSGSRGFRVLRENTSWNARRFLSEKPSAGEITLDDLCKIFTRGEDFPELL
ncbi:MAG: ATP-grasp domain-containing protein, partial [Nitrososphaerales archaeon]